MLDDGRDTWGVMAGEGAIGPVLPPLCCRGWEETSRLISSTMPGDSLFTLQE